MEAKGRKFDGEGEGDVWGNDSTAGLEVYSTNKYKCTLFEPWLPSPTIGDFKVDAATDS